MILIETYGILTLSLIATAIYTVIILMAVVVASHITRREGTASDNLREASRLLIELKQTIYRRNINMETREAYTLKSHLNQLTLTDLVTQDPTEGQYEEVVGILARVAKATYEKYHFLIVKSNDEVKDSHFMQLVSHSSELPLEHKLVFSKSIDYGLDMQVIQKKFAERVQAGEVVDLGEEAIVIVDDGTGQTATGVSPINSGLEGGEIAFNISFILKENFALWEAEHFPKEVEDSKDEGTA